jgi:transposase InsO family protein
MGHSGEGELLSGRAVSGRDGLGWRPTDRSKDNRVGVGQLLGQAANPERTDVELATLGWVHWHNTERLHSYLGDVPPAEFETTHYASLATTNATVGNQ